MAWDPRRERVYIFISHVIKCNGLKRPDPIIYRIVQQESQSRT